MGNTLHLLFFPMAVSTCIPHRHLRLIIFPWSLASLTACFSSVGLYLWGWPHYLPNYAGLKNQSFLTSFSPPTPHLMRLSNSIKSIFATFLKPNFFRSYCHDLTLGFYFHFFLLLQWLWCSPDCDSMQWLGAEILETCCPCLSSGWIICRLHSLRNVI